MATINPAAQSAGTIVPIQSLEPERGLLLLKPILAVVRAENDEFAASFFDANIHASGDNETEALDNLRDLIVSKFERYMELGDAKLGPAPMRDWAVLKEFIARRE